MGEELISEKKNRDKGPVLKVAQKATTTTSQSRPERRSEAVGPPEPNTYSAVALCFSSTKDVVFLIAVIPGVTAGEQLALSWRGHRQQVSPHPGGHTSEPAGEAMLLTWGEKAQIRSPSPNFFLQTPTFST